MDNYRHYHIKLNYDRDKRLIEALDKARNKIEFIRLLYFYYDCFKDVCKLPWIDLELGGGDSE